MFFIDPSLCSLHNKDTSRRFVRLRWIYSVGRGLFILSFWTDVQKLENQQGILGTFYF